jgi:hypothetical protein
VSARAAEQIADAVLYEGYVLYPYRASAAKNRLRWQVGLVVPRDYADATGADPCVVQTECLLETGAGAALTVRVRCLHVQERQVERWTGPDAGRWERVESVTAGERQLITWEEAVAREFVRESLPVGRSSEHWTFAWALEGGDSMEMVRDDAGALLARIVRSTAAVTNTVGVHLEPCGAFTKVRVRVENVTPCAARSLAERGAAVRQSLAGTHAILSIDGGAFVSLLEPPPAAEAAAAACRNLHTWPVLVGARGSRDVMLSSPIILYDYPAVAPESPGDFCDATEIDEMLMLRVQTLTAEEKREARATDDRAARIIDRADSASGETMGRLHGAIRESWETFLNPPDAAAPEESWLAIGTVRIGNGSRVRLKPSHRSDSMDICLDGRTATVTAVHRTLEDLPYVTVVLDDDPFGAAGARYRRGLFFHPDEIVPIEDGGSVAP